MSARSVTQIEWAALRSLALMSDNAMPVESFVATFDGLPDPNYKYHVLWDFIVDGLVRFNEEDDTVSVTLSGLDSWLDLSILNVQFKVYVNGACG